jgi:plasmid stabilization system protein ParE
MAADLILAPEIEEDIAAAYGWYEARRPGLGEDFLSALEACLESIRRHPEMYALTHETYRRALLRRFPYGVFYEYSREVIVVYGVFHTSMNPDKWRMRLS